MPFYNDVLKYSNRTVRYFNKDSLRIMHEFENKYQSILSIYNYLSPNDWLHG